jgi:NAD(P)-dependent dehydrogenase (short-subunit alcohol dehydrogenase family)/AcrR family transcriptional regulator
MKDIPTTIKSKKLVEKRREQIVYAAIKLFAKKGFHKTTIRDLAVETGLSQGNIYDYVQNKEDILFLIHHFLSNVASETLHQSIENIEDPLEKLRRLIRAEIGIIDRFSDANLLMYRETHSLKKDRLKETLQNERDRLAIFETIIHECIEAGQFSAGNIRLISNLVKSMIDTWSLKRWDLRGHADRTEAERAILDLVFHGLRRDVEADSTVPAETTDMVGKTALVVNGGTALGAAIQTFLVSRCIRAAVYLNGTNLKQEFRGVSPQKAESVQLYDSKIYGPMHPELFRKIESDLGTIDIFIHDLGIGNIKIFANDVGDSEAGRRLNENLACAQEMAGYYQENVSRKHYGRIIYLAPWAWDSLAHPLRYETVKGSTISLTKAMAGMLAVTGITVNCIVPGYIRSIRPSILENEYGPDITGRIPMSCLGDISDVTNALRYLISDDAKYITGHVLNCSGGLD